MMLRIIHGKLKPGTWDSYERAYKDIMATAGKFPGLRGRCAQPIGASGER
jgi:antibiotic biosynthesis monooxygenase (ABM) superfamily enzyme